MNEPCYAHTVDGKKLIVVCRDAGHRQVLRTLGARRWFLSSNWTVSYSSYEELARIFKALRDAEFSFLETPAGWPAAAMFELLSEKGLIGGSYQAITWRGPGDFVMTTRHCL